MARFVVLDTGPLGFACSQPGTPSVDRCRAWLVHLEFSAVELIIPAVADYEVRRELVSAVELIIPAVADYEVRRELVRLGATAKLRRLDALRARFGCLDVRVAAFDRAAEFWGLLRRGGLQTAADAELDGDALLAGMAVNLQGLGDIVTIATMNIRHFGRFPGIDAREWFTIT